MTLLSIPSLLRENTYPGRGILLGRSVNNRCAVIAYFIMGRSENSRNRVFAATEDGIRTQAYDPSKVTDPSLILYHPIRVCHGKTIVTNGDQTDTIGDALAAGESFRQALQTREFEPDAPNYTPRISGLVSENGGYELSILKSLGGCPECCCRYFFTYSNPQPGVGHFIHTYQCDGNPIPSFEGEPRRVSLDTPDAASLADLLWDNLNSENRISLFVRYLDLATGKTEDVICNRN